MMKIIRFFKLHKILKERMAVIDETMNLKKAIDVYSVELIEEEEKFWDDGEMIFRRLKKELNEP